MEPMTPYNHASNVEVAKAITLRLLDLPGKALIETQVMLGEAVYALLEINEAIPTAMKHRHLVAGPLEAFADGPVEEDPQTKG